MQSLKEKIKKANQEELKEEINHFKRALEDVPYCCKKIMQLNQLIDYKRHEMTGLARHGVELTPEQELSPLSMPKYKSNKTLIDRFDEVDELEREMNYYRKKIMDCASVDKLEPHERELLLNIYFFHLNQWDLCAEFDLSRGGLQKRITAIINKCLSIHRG